MGSKKYEIRRRYDATAKQYDSRYLEIQTTKYQELFSEIKIKSSDIILDVGGGTGLLLDFLKENSSNVICCDISFNMLKIGKKKHTRGNFICADSDFLPFREEGFDKVFCISVLNNLPKYHKTMVEMNFLLHKKGKLVLTALTKIFSKVKIEELILNANFAILKLWKLSIEDIAVLAKKNKKKE
ncbi:MAG: class I SAM-dependent methyltransferase [Candidatus Heimdallarchaeota archaeon]|nr:class I SAM-dependent methyltransferase [Candidatus Heimdallarchaeota archaeon]